MQRELPVTREGRRVESSDCPPEQPRSVLSCSNIFLVVPAQGYHGP
jgi:hypothetical protein